MYYCCCNNTIPKQVARSTWSGLTAVLCKWYMYNFSNHTQRTWSVTLLAPDAWLSKNIIRNALDTFRRQTKGSVGVCSDLSDRDLMNEARNRIHFKNGSSFSTLLWLLVHIELLALPYILYAQTMTVCGDFFYFTKYWIEQFEVLPCPTHAEPLYPCYVRVPTEIQ